MFSPDQSIIDSFVAHSEDQFVELFPRAGEDMRALLHMTSRSALELLMRCDCPYHDLQHTVLVTDIGMTMLRGRQISDGDVTPEAWLHAVVAMLYHDIGYVRALLRNDSPGGCIVNEAGERVIPPRGATDAFLTPHHVKRSALYARERFANEPLLDINVLARHIEMTRCPVPNDPAYRSCRDFSSLVRAADLLGQMADPLYMQKLSRLFTEFIETGEAQRRSFKTAGELKASFAEFFFSEVRPHVGEGLDDLRQTQDGQQWIANLCRHLNESAAASSTRQDAAERLEQIPLPLRSVSA